MSPTITTEATGRRESVPELVTGELVVTWRGRDGGGRGRLEDLSTILETSLRR